jgi:acid phosphatase
MKKLSRAAMALLALLALWGTVAPCTVSAGQNQNPAAQTDAAQTRGFVANEAAERIPNVDTVKTEARAYYACTCKCGCYARDFTAQAEKGLQFLTQRAAHQAQGEKLAMVLDIDETSLSNWEEMSKADFTYRPHDFTAWENEARAPALEGTLQLFRKARKLGVSVFFITGRPEEERAATEKNLRTAGYNDWQGLVLRPAHPPTQTTTEYKSAARGKIVAQGYTLVLNAGDQWSDLNGNPQAEFSLKYPNPFYFIP